MRAAQWLLLAAVVAAPVDAAVFRDVVYVRGATDERAQSLDVYTPATPGSHAVALYLDVAADKGATRGRHAAFNAHDMVFVSANVRGAPASARLDDIVALLAWAQRSASRYGGDPERVHLIAAGDAASSALVASDDVARRAQFALVPGTPAGLVAIAPSSLPHAVVPAGTSVPRLLLFAAGDAVMHARVDAYVERTRGAGVAALALPGSGRDADAMVREFGTPTDPDAALVLAWLDSRAIARVPRFEQLVWHAEESPHAAARIAGLAAIDDTWLVATSSADGTARIAARAAAGGEWHDEAAWPSARVLALIVDDAGAQALLEEGTGGRWCARSARGEWSCVAMTGLAGDPATPPERLAGEIFIATGGPAGGVFRVVPDGAGMRATRDEPPGARDARIVACGGALLAASGNALWRRDGGAWIRVAQWLPDAARNAAALALACVPDPAGSGSASIIAAVADGRVLRIDARGDVVLELGARAAFSELWREPGLRASFAPTSIVALRQPDTGDVVHAIALAFVFAGQPRPGAYWLLRALDGTYSYGAVRARDAAAPAASIALAAGSGHGVLASLDGATVGMLRGELPPLGPHAGLWWDPSRPGEAIELASDGNTWSAIVHDHAADGTTRWTQHTGELRAGVFVEGGDVPHEGALRIAFGGEAASCPTPRAAASVARDGGIARWCIEPFLLPGAGRPHVDGSGTWRSAAPGEHWELSTVAQGYDGDTIGWVMLRWMDEHEQRRWLFGVAPQAHGALRVALDAGHCANCKDGATGALELHWFGQCGEGGGVASLELRDTGRIVLRRKDIAIDAVARQPCY